MTSCNNPCPATCQSVFDMVHVSYIIRGGTRIMWLLNPDFKDPNPWSFQVQVGMTGNPDADDWVNVGSPVVNSCYAIDPNRRVYGLSQYTHYRIVLTTPKGTYYSFPVSKTGVLAKRDWLIAAEIIRKEKLRYKLAGQEGYLLKYRANGDDCTRCIDFQTQEPTDPNCPQCKGTGRQCGYFYPMACVWADLSPKAHRMHIDDQGTRGTINDVVVTARMLMFPLIDELDVWVSAKTDDRYYIQTIQHIAEVRGVPILANVELRLAPYTDIVYSIEIPQQDEAISEVTCA